MSRHDATLVAEALGRVASKGGLDYYTFNAEPALVELGYVVLLDAGPQPNETGLRLALTSICQKIEAKQEAIGRKRLNTAEIGRAVSGLGDYHGLSLMDRRNTAGIRVGCSGPTVAVHQEAVLSRIAELLVAFAGRPPDLDPRLKESVASLASAHDRQPKWVRSRQDDLFVFDRDGAMTEIIHTIELTSQDVRPIPSIILWHEYIEDSSPGVIVAERADRCQVLRQDDANGGHFTELLLEPPLRQSGENREIGLRLSIRTERRCRPRVKNGSVTGPSASIALQFSPHSLPAEIWWWQQTGNGQEFAPVPDQSTKLNAAGYVKHPFYNIGESENIGLGWHWPE